MCFLFQVCLVSLVHLIPSCLAVECLPTTYPIVNCSCINKDAVCHGMDSIPRLRTPLTLNSLTIYDSPGLHNLPNNIFQDLTVKLLSLANNHLMDSDFQINTFAGLTVEDVDLSNNKLTAIPEAIASVKDIKGLSVSGNPITDFGHRNQSETMKHIGNSLERFSFGSSDIIVWPRELKHFPRLIELNVTGGEFSLMPLDAFYGFERSLSKLLIDHSLLRSVPLAFARLLYLTELRFDHNQFVGDFGMNVPLINDLLSHLGLLSLKGDNITTFPQILGRFNHLTHLEMGENSLKFVSDQSANSVKHVTHLSLRNSSISRIPGALQDISTLESLDLSINGIHSVEREDVEKLTNLNTLKLNSNPLLYISKDVFKNSDNLATIELRNTSLIAVPCAFRNLRLDKFNIVVDVSGDDITCTCSLQWLYAWVHSSVNHHHFKILGNCLTVDSTIQDYLDKTLSSCPESRDCVNV